MNFIKHLRWEELPARQRVLSAFVLTCVMDGNPKGQEKCLQKLLHTTCFELLEDGGGGDVSAARCCVLCLAMLRVLSAFCVFVVAVVGCMLLVLFLLL